MLRALFAALLLSASAFAGVPRVHEDIKPYKPAARVGGDLTSAGSDTMLNLMTSWGEVFRKYHPSARVQVEGKGSSTAPPALLEGQAQFGPMSRAMEPDELDLFKEEFGFEPLRLRAAIDCVAIFVHRSCPLESITLEQLRDVFSVEGERTTWGDLGVEDAGWANQPVSLYGRNSASGTYKFFKDMALDGSDYKPTVKEAPGSSGVVQAVSTDRFAMGYSGVGYRTSDVKVLRVAFESGEEAFTPDQEHAESGDYPLARFLYLYTIRDPRKPMDPLRAEFVRLVFSREGQECVVKDGAYPVPPVVAKQELRRAGLLATDG